MEVIILVNPDGQGGAAPLKGELPRRVPGSAKGLITMADDFQAPLDDDVAQEFYQ